MEQKILRRLRELTGHDYVKLTASGNNAIFFALSIVRNLGFTNVVIPDQGGWFSYKTYPEMLGMKVSELETDYGVIDSVKLDSKSVLLYSNPAGYYAEQDSAGLFKIAKEKKSLVILDASGGVGTEMCNGKYADIIVGSFGKDKPVNMGYGGFISTNDKSYFEDKVLFSLNAVNMDYEKLDDELERLKKRLKMFQEVDAKIKKDLNDFEILHPSKRGINVIVKFNGDGEKNTLIAYCDKNNYEYTLCPRYIRVNEDAVSIEVKRLR